MPTTQAFDLHCYFFRQTSRFPQAVRPRTIAFAPDLLTPMALEATGIVMG